MDNTGPHEMPERPTVHRSHLSTPRLCPGLELKVANERVPACSYPFGLHEIHSVPWDVTVKPNALFLRSTSCRKKLVDSSPGPCVTCSDLLRNDILSGILDRIMQGT